MQQWRKENGLLLGPVECVSPSIYSCRDESNAHGTRLTSAIFLLFSFA